MAGRPLTPNRSKTQRRSPEMDQVIGRGVSTRKLALADDVLGAFSYHSMDEADPEEPRPAKARKVRHSNRGAHAPFLQAIPLDPPRRSSRIQRVQQQQEQEQEQEQRRQYQRKSSPSDRSQGQRHCPPARNTLGTPRSVNKGPKKNQEPETEPFAPPQCSKKGKPQQYSDHASPSAEPQPSGDLKRPKYPELGTSRALSKLEAHIWKWLENTSPPPKAITSDTRFAATPYEMAPAEDTDPDGFKKPSKLPTPRPTPSSAPITISVGDSSDLRTSSQSSSRKRKSEDSNSLPGGKGVDYRSGNYDWEIEKRNVFIEYTDAPSRLVDAAMGLLNKERTAQRIVDHEADKLLKLSRELRRRGEASISGNLISHLLPAAHLVDDWRLLLNRNARWTKAPMLPLRPGIGTGYAPLKLPQPDGIYGYNGRAFSFEQQVAIEHLTDDGHYSFAQVDDGTLFPFLTVELKSQIKGGTDYAATNQAANTGSVALYSFVKFMKLGYGMEDFDYEKPLFFSITGDHRVAFINIHWLEPGKNGEEYAYHMQAIDGFPFVNREMILRFNKAVWNIIDWGMGPRLDQICQDVDRFRENFVQAANEASSRQQAQSKEVTSEVAPAGPTPSPSVVPRARAQSNRLELQSRDSEQFEPHEREL